MTMSGKSDAIAEGGAVFFARADEVVKRRCRVTEGVVSVLVSSKWVCSRYIALFSMSPPDIVCPQFWELKWALGCPFSCAYCYLQGTLFGNKSFRVKNLDGLKKELWEFLSWATSEGIRVLLNSGELCDSLAVPEAAREFVLVVVEVLKEFPEHRMLIVTKGGVTHVKPFIEASRGFEELFIVSFSVNSEEVARRFEKAPTSKDRLEASKLVQERGYVLRLRIDPMIPVESWEKHYTTLIDLIFSKYELKPERITLGVLRGLYKTIRFSKERSWIRYLDKSERTGWGLRPSYELRKAMYIHIIEKLREYGYRGYIALCKETYNMWLDLAKEGYLPSPGERGVWQNTKCNCRL